MKQISHTYGHPSSYLSNNYITIITIENIYWVLAVCHIPDGNNYTNHKRNGIRPENLGSRNRKPVLRTGTGTKSRQESCLWLTKDTQERTGGLSRWCRLLWVLLQTLMLGKKIVNTSTWLKIRRRVRRE